MPRGAMTCFPSGFADRGLGRPCQGRVASLFCSGGRPVLPMERVAAITHAFQDYCGCGGNHHHAFQDYVFAWLVQLTFNLCELYQIFVSESHEDALMGSEVAGNLKDLRELAAFDWRAWDDLTPSLCGPCGPCGRTASPKAGVGSFLFGKQGCAGASARWTPGPRTPVPGPRGSGRL